MGGMNKQKHPAWPGRVVSVSIFPFPQAEVHYFGHDSFDTLDLEDLRPFEADFVLNTKGHVEYFQKTFKTAVTDCLKEYAHYHKKTWPEMAIRCCESMHEELRMDRIRKFIPDPTNTTTFTATTTVASTLEEPLASVVLDDEESKEEQEGHTASCSNNKVGEKRLQYERRMALKRKAASKTKVAGGVKVQRYTGTLKAKGQYVANASPTPSL